LQPPYGWCGGGSETFARLGGKIEPLLDRLGELAYDVSLIESQVSEYPATLWRADLNAFEEKMLVLLADRKMIPKKNHYGEFQLWRDLERDLKQKLNNYRLVHSTLPPVDFDEGCGVTEPVLIVTQPQARRVRFIQNYAFLFCIDQKIDPLNQNQCPRWTDYSGGRSGDQMAGRLKILVTWPTGDTAIHDLDVDRLVPDKAGKLVFVIRR
jgi:hypothetical protein